MWGEFLDHEWYAEGAPVVVPQDPWRTNPLWAGQTVEMSREILKKMVNKEQMQRIQLRDMAKVHEVAASISEVGLERPLTLVVDRAGWIVLKDGHHRLLATEGMGGYESLPCTLKYSEKIRVASANLSEVLFDLLV